MTAWSVVALRKRQQRIEIKSLFNSSHSKAYSIAPHCVLRVFTSLSEVFPLSRFGKKGKLNEQCSITSHKICNTKPAELSV